MPVASALLLLCGLSTSAALSPYPLGLHAAATLLEVSLPTPKAAVRAAYRRKAAKSHPDVSKRADAASYFMRLTAAYETLLQFSVSVPVSVGTAAPDAASSPAHSATAAPPPQPPASSYASASTPHSTQRTTQRDPAQFEQQVRAWREFWAVSLQATQMQTEADRKSMQAGILAAERQRLRELLSEMVASGSGERVDACRARYAQASAKCADTECAARALAGRAQMLRRHAAELQEQAQGGADGFAP